MIFCTLAGKEQMAHAIVLARSVRQHHPDARMILCLAEHHVSAPHTENFDEVVQITNHGVPTDSFASLCAAKAYFIHHLLTTYDDTVVYLDPFVKIYHRLNEIERLLREHDIIAVPYQLEPCEDNPGLEIERLRSGFLHAGFLALTHSQRSKQFTRWWSERVAGNYYQSKRDTNADHKWLSLGMIPFRIHLLKDSAYHAAYWNIHESGRKIALASVSIYTAGGKKLRTFHFDNQDERLDQRVKEWAENSNAPLHSLVQAYNMELEEVRHTFT